MPYDKKLLDEWAKILLVDFPKYQHGKLNRPFNAPKIGVPDASSFDISQGPSFSTAARPLIPFTAAAFSPPRQQGKLTAQNGQYKLAVDGVELDLVTFAMDEQLSTIDVTTIGSKMKQVLFGPKSADGATISATCLFNPASSRLQTKMGSRCAVTVHTPFEIITASGILNQLSIQASPSTLDRMEIQLMLYGMQRKPIKAFI